MRPFPAFLHLQLLAAAVLAMTLSGCQPTVGPPPPRPTPPVVGVDLSFMAEMEQGGAGWKDAQGADIELLPWCKAQGVNTVRLRLWVDPVSGHSTLPEAIAVAQRARQAGLRIWLAVHYSDQWADPGHRTLPEAVAVAQRAHQAGLRIWLAVHYSDQWADPGQQVTPVAWQNLNFGQLLAQVESYTQQVAQAVQPDILQVGNEINAGFLFPFGQITTTDTGFVQLLEAGLRGARTGYPAAQTMIHYAGIAGSRAFLARLVHLEPDLWGLSYYPWWHGSNPEWALDSMQALQQNLNIPVVVAETAYPFTLNWQDQTHNVVGLAGQLLSGYPASEAGQRNFVMHWANAVQTRKLAGWCYWGAEWTAWKGPNSQVGSSWENLALFDFDGRAVPAWDAMKASTP